MFHNFFFILCFILLFVSLCGISKFLLLSNLRKKCNQKFLSELNALITLCDETIERLKISYGFRPERKYVLEFIRNEAIGILIYCEKYGVAPPPGLSAYSLKCFSFFIRDESFSEWFFEQENGALFPLIISISESYAFLLRKKTYFYFDYIDHYFEVILSKRNFLFSKAMLSLVKSVLRLHRYKNGKCLIRCCSRNIKKLDQRVINKIQEKYSFIFPEAICELFRIGIPFSTFTKFYNGEPLGLFPFPVWQDFSKNNLLRIKERMLYPENCAKLFHLEILTASNGQIPKLIPVNACHYVPYGFSEDPPVFFIYLFEVELLSATFTEYVDLWLLGKQRSKKSSVLSGDKGEYIPFWSDLAASQKLRKEEFYKEWAHFDEN